MRRHFNVRRVGFRSSPDRPAHQLGFTLVELMVVVVIIAISAALVIPLAVRQLRDNQVHRIAKEVASTYRNARMLAMARGGAVVVRYDNGTISVREGVDDAASQGGACRLLPVTSCNRTGGADPWSGAGQETVQQLSGPGGSPPITIALQGGAFADVCYTPMGRSMRRPDTVTRFAPMNGALQLDVFRGPPAIGLTRVVSVWPSGAARLTTSELK